jgi:hypothetical protein
VFSKEKFPRCGFVLELFQAPIANSEPLSVQSLCFSVLQQHVHLQRLPAKNWVCYFSRNATPANFAQGQSFNGQVDGHRYTP